MPTPSHDRVRDVGPQPLFTREPLVSGELDLALLFHTNTKFHAALSPVEADPMAFDESDLPPATSLQYVPLEGPGRVQLPTTEAPVALDRFVEVVASRRSRRHLSGQPVPLASLATLLQLTYGVTGTLEDLDEPGRAAPSAGGRFPLEVFVAAQRVDELDAGWYHYHPETHTLELVREGDPRDAVSAAFFGQPFLADAAFVLVLGAVLGRTMVKYGERGYRLVLLDAGHAGAHAYLAATALGLGACGLGGFLDDDLHGILKLNGVDEVVLYGVAVGAPAP